MAELTAYCVREALDYSPETGLFHWKESRCGVYKEKNGLAGHRRKDGYTIIIIDGHRVLAHRLAWLYVTGVWPKSDIDHADMDRGNNRWVNLREAERWQNIANTSLKSNSTTKLKGVDKHKGQFRARITVDKKQVHLGYFSCPTAAHFAYIAAADKHFAEFARVR